MTELANNDKSLSENNENISDKLVSEIFDTSLDLSVDYSEIFIDDIVQSDAIKEIPIIKSIVGVVKSGISINNFWFAKKILVFIQEFNSGEIDEQKLTDYKQKLKDEPKLGKRIAERLMVFIDRNIEIKQTQIIANLFKAYVNQDISFDQLNNILVTLDNLNPKSLTAFFDLEKIDFAITETNHKEVKRNFEMEILIANSGFATEPSSWFRGFKLTEDGTALFKFGIKPLRSK